MSEARFIDLFKMCGHRDRVKNNWGSTVIETDLCNHPNGIPRCTGHEKFCPMWKAYTSPPAPVESEE